MPRSVHGEAMRKGAACCALLISTRYELSSEEGRPGVARSVNQVTFRNSLESRGPVLGNMTRFLLLHMYVNLMRSDRFDYPSFRRKPESSLIDKGLDPGFRRDDDEETNESGM